MSYPFIVLFETYKKKYVYDVNTNTILRISSLLWKELKTKQENDSYQYSLAAEKELHELKKRGFFLENRWISIKHPATDIFPYQLNSALAAVVLQVTQICNLNCSYCPFAQGNYYSRKHSKKQMSIEIAKKAIDFLVDNAINSNILAVGFYGGEPLINFELVKSVVEYISLQYPHKKFSYFMTTNATLLDEEKIAFLSEHEFSITISLDGPREIHDRNRQSFSHESSFDKIMEAVKIIKEKFPEFHKKIIFNCVIDPTASFDCFHSFFTSYEEINDYICKFSNISRANLKSDDMTVSNDYLTRYNFEIFKSILSRTGRIETNAVSPIVSSYMIDLLEVMFEKRHFGRMGEIGHPGGPCIPGGRKIFVNADGDIFPCEKVNELSDNMKIGNVYNGFYLDKCSKLLNIATLTEEECKQCWACRLCYLCCLFCEKNGELSRSQRLSNCKMVRQHLINYFKIYACLIEHDYNKSEEWFDSHLAE